jgi:hypothetical protein
MYRLNETPDREKKERILGVNNYLSPDFKAQIEMEETLFEHRLSNH